MSSSAAARTAQPHLSQNYTSIFDNPSAAVQLDTENSTNSESTVCTEDVVPSRIDNNSSQKDAVIGNEGVKFSSADQDVAHLLTPDPGILKQMHTVRAALPRTVSQMLGDISYDTRHVDLKRWVRKLRVVPLKVLKPLAKEMVYHFRNGNKKTISVHGKKHEILKRFVTYGFKYAEQKNPSSLNANKQDHVHTDGCPIESGAVLVNPENEQGIGEFGRENRNTFRPGRLAVSDARRLTDLEAQEAIANDDFIGALSANEVCRALHALCDPESMSAARKVFQDSSRLQLDASCSQGLSPVDAGWTFIAGLYNDAKFTPKNIRIVDVELEHLDPSKIETPRGPESLKTAISALRSSYQEAERRFFKSGNNDAEFFAYCNGNSVLVYCHHLLNSAPHIREAFPRALPKNVGVSTGGDAPIPARPRRQSHTTYEEEPTLREPSRKKKNTAKSEIGSALRDHTESLVNMKQAQFIKNSALREKYLELQKLDVEERATARKEQSERVKVKRNQEVGDALCALNQSAKVISDQIGETMIVLAQGNLSDASRVHNEERLDTLQKSYERLNCLIRETLDC